MVLRMNYLPWHRTLVNCRPRLRSSSSSTTTSSSCYVQRCFQRFPKSHRLILSERYRIPLSAELPSSQILSKKLSSALPTSSPSLSSSALVKSSPTSPLVIASSSSSLPQIKSSLSSATQKKTSPSFMTSPISSRLYHPPSSTSSLLSSKQNYSTSVNPRITEIDHTNAKDILSRYDAILLDCDGVLWKTDHVTPIPGIPEVMKQLQRMNKKIFFVTNNSMLSRDMCFDKFSCYDINPGSKDNVYCMAYSAAIFLRDVLKVTGCVYNAGSLGMERELTLAGLENIGTGPDPDTPSQEIEDLLNMYFRNDVQAVVVGFDEYFSYTKLYKAASYLSNPDCHFVVTSGLGSGVLIGPNRFQPFTGPIVSAVMTASRREPILIGKPDSHMFESIIATQPEVDKNRCLMIGDSLKADIGFAKASGIDSALVLTGSSSLEDMKDYPGMDPEFYMKSLSSFMH